MTVLSADERRRWLYLVRWLRSSFPPPFFVRVRTQKITARDLGQTRLKREGHKKLFIITISSDLDLSNRLETLLHEWAHACNWSFRHEREGCEHHDESWGVWYAKIFSAYERHFHS